MSKHDPRRVRLVRPRLQMRMILTFLGVAACSLLLQYVLFSCAITWAAAGLPQDGPILLERAAGLCLAILLVSLGVLLPLSFFVGVLVTFRVAGPLHRFERHLDAIAHGVDPGTCRIRSGDELQDFCAVLNAALERVRADGRLGGAETPGARSEAA